DFDTDTGSTERVDDAGDVLAVAASKQLCILRASGQVLCRGNRVRYQPHRVADLADAVQLRAGGYSACALRRGGAGVCWGSIDPLMSKASSLEAIEGLVGVATLHVGGNGKVCAIDAAGRLSCGSSFDFKAHPLATGIRQVSLGHHGCAVRTDGQVQCWGDGSKGQLGDGGHASAPESAPLLVRDLHDAAEVAVGYDFSCARRRGGQVRCWGAGVNDQMHGDPGIGDAVQLAAGISFACARRRGGTVTCWGDPPRLRADQPYGTSPADLPGVRDAVDLAADEGALCVARATGRVTCAGLLTGRPEDREVFDIEGITDATAVAVGDLHACALHRTGAVSCWGSESEGGVGDGAAEHFTAIDGL
ncbi:MAG TPA: hypothetical protein VL172_15450, partial [Kofleriaceae bacterium]|nr:hypothetical protein [Kofleriaceae bacterium]